MFLVIGSAFGIESRSVVNLRNYRASPQRHAPVKPKSGVWGSAGQANETNLPLTAFEDPTVPLRCGNFRVYQKSFETQTDISDGGFTVAVDVSE